MSTAVFILTQPRQTPAQTASAFSPPGTDNTARARTKPAMPRLAYRVPAEAAEVLGVSVDTFDAHIRADLKLVRRGRLVLVAHAELEAWLARSGSSIAEDLR